MNSSNHVSEIDRTMFFFSFITDKTIKKLPRKIQYNISPEFVTPFMLKFVHVLIWVYMLLTEFYTLLILV
jgi:hypothetical protein